jgi:hypothetical protein
VHYFWDDVETKGDSWKRKDCYVADKTENCTDMSVKAGTDTFGNAHIDFY